MLSVFMRTAITIPKNYDRTNNNIRQPIHRL